MRKKIILFLLLLKGLTILSQTKIPCAQKPEVTKYTKIGGQWGPQCATLALYLCQCSSGEVLKQDEVQFKSVLEQSNSNVKTAHEQNLTKVCPELIDKIKVCNYGEPANQNKDQTKDYGNAISELNKSNNQKIITYGTGILMGAMILEALTDGTGPVSTYRDELPDEYSLDEFTSFSEELNKNNYNGFGSKKMTINEKWTKNNNIDRDGWVCFAGIFEGIWKNGIPTKGVFYNNYLNPKVNFIFNIDSVNFFKKNNSSFLNYKKLNGKNLVFLGFDSRKDLYNSSLTFLFCPNALDTVKYTEQTNSKGLLGKRVLTSNYFQYVGEFDWESNIEKCIVKLCDSTIIKFNVKKPLSDNYNYPEPVLYNDTVKYIFPNGDYYCYTKNGQFNIKDADIKLSEKLENGVYFKDKKETTGISQYFSQNSNDLKINKNYLAVLFWESIYNPTVTKQQQKELLNKALNCKTDNSSDKLKALFVREQISQNQKNHTQFEYYNYRNFKTRFRKPIKGLSETKIN
jgi:hypothetical protein